MEACAAVGAARRTRDSWRAACHERGRAPTCGSGVLGKSSQTVQEKLRCVRLSVIGVRPGAVAVAAVLRKERVKTGLNVLFFFLS